MGTAYVEESRLHLCPPCSRLSDPPILLHGVEVCLSPQLDKIPLCVCVLASANITAVSAGMEGSPAFGGHSLRVESQ